MSKRILSVGFHLGCQLVEAVQFDTNRSFLEFDIVVIDWSSFIKSAQNIIDKHGVTHFNSRRFSRFRQTLEQRKKTLREFGDHNRLIVILCDPIQNDIQHYGNDGISYTWELDSEIPSTLFQMEQATGSKVEPAPDLSSPLRNFASAIKGHVLYHGTLPTRCGTPVLNISGTKKTVATWDANEGGGGILYCPFPITSGNSFDAFAHSLIVLYEELHAVDKKETPELPVWHEKYQLPMEVVLSSNLRGLNQDLEELRRKIDSEASKLDKTLCLKRLFTDKGDSLLSAAMVAFESIGFTVELGPEGRDDLIMESANGVKFVVEVKGRDSKGAAESDAAQLEKWSSGFYHSTGTEPKGVLVINGHRLTPLSERKEPVFPDQMLGYAKRKGQCLLTGFQLLAFVLAVQQGKSTSEDIQRRISVSSGPCQLYHELVDCLAMMHREASVGL